MSETTAPDEAIVQKPARIQRDFAALRQEIESKNTSIRREIRAVASQIDRIRNTGADRRLDVSGSFSPLEVSTSSLKLGLRDAEQSRSGELAPKDPTTALVVELQAKLEAQQSDLDDARAALSTAKSELEEFKARSLSDEPDDKRKLDTVSQRVLELTAVVEDQQAEIDRANAQLSARAVELARLEAELSSSSKKKALEDEEDLGPRRMRAAMKEQAAEIASLKGKLVACEGLKNQALDQIAALQELNASQQSALDRVASDARREKQQIVEAQEAEIAALRVESRQLEELQSSYEDMRVELATTKAQLVTRNLEMTKVEAQLVGRNTELAKYEEQRAELASVKAQLLERDLKLVKQEVTKVLEPAEEASEDREGALRARIALLESEAAANADTMRKLEDDLRRRDELLVKTPRRQLEALAHDAGETLADELAQLASAVLTKNDALAEKQLIRARAFLKVLQDAAWTREATPKTFKLGKFLDDVASSLEPRIKALSAAGNAISYPAPSSSSSIGRSTTAVSLGLSAPPSSVSPPSTVSVAALPESSDGGQFSSRITPSALPQDAALKPLSYKRPPSMAERSSPSRAADIVASSVGSTSSPFMKSSSSLPGGVLSTSHLRQRSPPGAGTTLPTTLPATVRVHRPSLTSSTRADNSLRDAQDPTTEAILSSLQNSGSSFNYSNGSISSRVLGSASTLYSSPDREDSRNNQQRTVRA